MNEAVEQLGNWHLSKEISIALDQVAPAKEDKAIDESIVEVQLDLEMVSVTLKKLFHSSMLLYFMDCAPSVILVTN